MCSHTMNGTGLSENFFLSVRIKFLCFLGKVVRSTFHAVRVRVRGINPVQPKRTQVSTKPRVQGGVEIGSGVRFRHGVRFWDRVMVRMGDRLGYVDPRLFLNSHSKGQSSLGTVHPFNLVVSLSS